MSAIFYFCVFEQRHITKLKCTDILVNEHRIRNVRTDDNQKEQLAKWIYLGEDVIKFIVNYICIYFLCIFWSLLHLVCNDYAVKGEMLLR